MPEPLISLRDFTFRYPTQESATLTDINLRIDAGEKVAIVGPSGCGKSTLVKVLNSLAFHQDDGVVEAGSVRVAGVDPARAEIVEVSRRVGTVLQNSADQFVGLTVAEDIAFSLENQRVAQRDMREAVTKAARQVGIADFLASSPQALSGGQKQRVAMAGVLVDDVDILLFDEPLAMLDPASGRAAVELIDRLNRELGKTVIIVEHRLEDVLHCPVDRVVLMNSGRIIADMTPDELVASGLLEENGIRPPLHAAALRYAGVHLRASMHPSNAAHTVLSEEDVARVRGWVGEPVSAPSIAADAVAAVEVRDLTVAYEGNGDQPDNRVLEQLSATIPAGQMVSIVGSNGAGKSTLARALAGFEKPREGTVLIGGEDAARWSLAEQAAHVGFVLQEPGQMLSQPRVWEEVALGLKARGVEAERSREIIRHVLTVCGLWPYRSWPISALSHGQKKRLTIAAMLALGPTVLILDEPTAGQDFRHYTEFMEFIRGLNRAGTTVLLITHDMHLALEYTQRCLVMSHGKIIADAAPARVLTDPAVTARADLVPTGLYTYAQRYGFDAEQLVRRFLQVDRAKHGGTAGDDPARVEEGAAGVNDVVPNGGAQGTATADRGASSRGADSTGVDGLDGKEAAQRG
ncbi:ABC transporter ATP-binding protein [Neoactinobaculum massilliense]|uniref:ABC transporter ATP-binding protein n=1 Tax=Neoactinobaculum massilliense TaxID=2364794 RepID=UPI0013DE7466|nr:DUF3744 domain-containing protein [Neoactinobaculum massilliense]